MTPERIFQIQLVTGYVVWLLVFRAWVWPWLGAMERFKAQRVIAGLSAFRFFGLVFLLPGVVGPHVPVTFATDTALGDFATAVLAILALLTVRIRPLFWLFVVAFNVLGCADLLLAYANAIAAGVPAQAGQQLIAAYWVPVLYVPALMLSHLTAFWFLLRRRGQAKAAHRVETAA
jgi:hypothetical protein